MSIRWGVCGWCRKVTDKPFCSVTCQIEDLNFRAANPPPHHKKSEPAPLPPPPEAHVLGDLEWRVCDHCGMLRTRKEMRLDPHVAL